MSFSAEWDQVYRQARHLSVWPWSDLVSYVHRHARPADGFRRVLELGCGAGANIPFFLDLGMDYFAIEGSGHIVARLHERFPETLDRIVAADFTKAIPFTGQFDLIVDRGSVTHNTTPAIRATLTMACERLRSGGKLIGLDWLSAEHKDAVRGESIDSHTRTNIPDGQFQGLGKIHFADQQHLVELLTGAGFSIDRLEHKRIDRVLPAENGLCWWNFVTVKP
jgi:SAM-dependent methyltransferase